MQEVSSALLMVIPEEMKAVFFLLLAGAASAYEMSIYSPENGKCECSPSTQLAQVTMSNECVGPFPGGDTIQSAKGIEEPVENFHFSVLFFESQGCTGASLRGVPYSGYWNVCTRGSDFCFKAAAGHLSVPIVLLVLCFLGVY